MKSWLGAVAKIAPLHSSLGNNSETLSQKEKKKVAKQMISPQEG